VIPPSTTISHEGRRLRRILLWAGGLVVALNLVVFIVGSSSTGGSVSGPSGSSYATTPHGSAALAGTLERLGADVIRSRTSLDETALTSDMTLAAIEVGEAGYTATELNVLDAFVWDGGRLVVVGPTSLVDHLVTGASTWRTAGSNEAEFTRSSGVDTVLLSTFGSFRRTSSDEPLLVGPDGEVVAVMRDVGRGTIVWVADGEPFRNRGIGRGDNGAAAVALLGSGRTVVFDEFRHGYVDEAGLWGTLPSPVRTTLLLGCVVALLAMISYGRRFGPPYDVTRRLGPSRGEYFRAMAGLLQRAGAVSDAVGVLRSEARRLLVRRGGEGADLTPTASAAGLATSEIEAILGSGTTADDLLAVDHAIATLTKERQ